jgi:hypothetical protein
MAPAKLSEDQVRLLKALSHRGSLRERDEERSSVVRTLIGAGLVRAVERPGEDTILVLSGQGVRRAESAH